MPKVDDITLRHRFDTVFLPGNIWTIQGPVRGEKKGTGKTTWATQILQQAIEYGYMTMGNILFKAPVRDENRNVKDWVERMPVGYLKVRSFAEAVYALSERGMIRRRQRAILVIDESMMIAGVRGGAGSGMQTREGATIVAFNTQIRKLGLCILIIGLGDRFLAGMYRSDDPGSITTGSMRRTKLPGWDVREVIEVKTASGAIYVNTMPIHGIARPQEWLLTQDADDGPVFESFSPATFSIGKFRKSGKVFDMNEFIAAMSDVISEHAFTAVEAFLDREGLDADKDALVAPPPRDEGDRTPALTLVKPDRAEAARAYIRAGGRSDAEIGRLVGLTRQRIGQIRNAMKGS